MAIKEIFQSIFKTAIELVVQKVWSLLIIFYSLVVALLLSIKIILLEHPLLLLWLVIIMTPLVFLFFILWIQIYWRYERFEFAFSVYWDKNYDMRCTNCRKLLKDSSSDTDPSIFYCSDIKCDNKHSLKDNSGTKITKQEAIAFLKAQK